MMRMMTADEIMRAHGRGSWPAGPAETPRQAGTLPEGLTWADVAPSPRHRADAPARTDERTAPGRRVAEAVAA